MTKTELQKEDKHNKKSPTRRIFKFIAILIIFLIIIGIGIAIKVYSDTSNSVNETYASVQQERQESEHTREVKFNNQEPFSVLLLGIDTGDLGRVERGRSDSIIVATINPSNDKITLVSIARDTYVDIIGRNQKDKINHAYAFGGAAMSMDTVSNYLDIPIDHYISINMAGIKDLVDAVGGVEVENDLEFESRGQFYPAGKIHLDGERALTFLRMRYEDPRGDYGRQLRQRLVVEQIIKKGMSLNGITQYKSILNTIEDNMQTDLSFSNIKDIALNYNNSFETFEQLQLQGTGFMQDGVSYQSVSDEELKSVQNLLKNELDIMN